MNKNLQNRLSALFQTWATEKPIDILPIPKSGSSRAYYRFKGRTASAIGVYNKNQNENKTFLSFDKHFFTHGLPVPQILEEDLSNNIYLLEDLGDQSLFDKLQDDGFSERVEEDYKSALKILPKFQIVAGKSIDYSLCYPRDSFDKQSILWDLNYFKYYFLKLSKTNFDEPKLESDFHTIAEYLCNADSDYFMHRDFQARNIMLKDGQPYFIDFQGGRKGALQYDVASLLWSARANIPFAKREELLQFYKEEVLHHSEINMNEFDKYYYGFVLIRILQTLGAYGYRGFYERKDHFLKSIPFALENLEWLIENEKVNLKADELFYVLAQLVKSDLRNKFTFKKNNTDTLNVTVTSFSYKDGIPYDTSGNGGGYVFDCRAIHNPGRYKEYKLLTGKDESVIKFLEEKSEVEKFLDAIKKLVTQSVKEYKERGFSNLMVNFGCTGGQHRSVYCAERLSNYLMLKAGLDVELIHTQLEKRDDI